MSFPFPRSCLAFAFLGVLASGASSAFAQSRGGGGHAGGGFHGGSGPQGGESHGSPQAGGFREAPRGPVGRPYNGSGNYWQNPYRYHHGYHAYGYNDWNNDYYYQPGYAPYYPPVYAEPAIADPSVQYINP